MRIPPEAYSAPITDYQFRLLATICHLAGSRGRFKASAEELGRHTGNAHERTVRRALKALREAGLITTVATKRANGYNGKLDISVTPEVDSNVRTEGGTNVRTSHDYLSGSNTVDIPLVPNSKDSNKYFETKGFTKEILVPMKNYDDGEDLAGFGLVEPKDAPQAKVRKSDPKTRGKRPQHEWTPMDVAAEFSFLMSIPIISASSIYEIYKFATESNDFSNELLTQYFVGAMVSFIVGLLAIKFLLGYLKNKSLSVFGIYRIFFGIFLLAIVFVK